MASAEQLEEMLLKGLPRYRWTADDVVKGMDLKERMGSGARERLEEPSPLPSEDKTIIVTGATSGIGIPTATALARTGCQLVITARDVGRGQAALETIRKNSGNAEAPAAR
eukprot:Skav220496  [mRNA]  locus=scaffold1191:76576:77697:- [translate_table: standard]